MDNSASETPAPWAGIPVMDSRFLAAVVDLACEQGADRDAILAGSLLRPDVLGEAGQPIPSACVYLASSRAAVLAGNPCLCADIARTYDWNAGFVPPETLSDMPSLGDLLVAWLYFVETVQVSTRYTLTINAARARLSGRRILKASQPPGQADAWDVVSWAQMFQDRLGPSWDNRRVEVETFDPEAIPRDLFAPSQVHKSDAWGVSLSFPSAWLMRQSAIKRPQADPEPAKSLPDPNLAQMFQAFDYSAWPGMERFARFLGLHPKTLQRRFAKCGTSGAELMDRAKRQLASRWLDDDTRTLKQIGHSLGYKNASAFTRACHRWFGASPEQIRMRPGSAGRTLLP